MRQAITLLRGYGVQLWTFWQDLSQLKHLYPNDWETIFNNSHVLQSFGITNHLLARTISNLMGVLTPKELLELDADEMALMMAGDETVIAQRPNYLSDPSFEGLYDDNPFYVSADKEKIKPQYSQRKYIRPPIL